MEYSVRCREVIPDQTRPEKCKEFTLNTGGTPSTLQDIKVQQRAGGFAYKLYPDRFIYWRTNHDVLELVEQSLSVNLTSNNIKYRFTDTPILDGVSIHETYSHVIVLVATVSSVHRLMFPHPDKLHAQKLSSESSLPSIFSQATLGAARDPSTYHILTSSPNLPHTSTSCLTVNGDAVFALAMSTGVILLIHLPNYSGATVITKELHQDTVVPRFLSGLTDAILGRNTEDSLAVSLVLHCLNGVFYLFAICRDGQLRVWNCEKGSCVDVHDVSNGSTAYSQKGGQNHSLRKSVGDNGELILCVFLSFLNNVRLFIVVPKLDFGSFRYTQISSLPTPENHDLVEVWLGGRGEERAVWCIWVTNQGETAISYRLVQLTNWVWASLQPSPPFERNVNPMIDPRQAYLEAIFEPGVFSVVDINRALSIYHHNSTINSGDDSRSGADLRQRVSQAVELEIQTEVSDFEMSDDDYLEISDRCWSKFYSCCVQYLQAGMTALGLFWLPAINSIAVVKKSGFSILRQMDQVEVLAYSNPDPTFEYKNLILKAIKMLDEGEEARFRIEYALNNIDTLLGVVAEVASDLASEKYFTQVAKNLESELCDGFNIDKEIENVLRLLSLPYPHSKSEDDHLLSSHLGISAATTTLEQLVNVRLDMSIKLLILLELSLGGSLKSSWKEDFKDLCQDLWTIKWLCQAQLCGPSVHSKVHLYPAHTSPLLLHKFLLLQEGFPQFSLLNAAASLALLIWPEKNSQVVAEFLLDMQEHLLLQNYASLVPQHSWSRLLAQSYLETGEPYKAFDLVSEETEHYFKTIQMFERHDLPDLVISLAKNAIHNVKLSTDHSDLPTLYSILFLNHLKLNHWECAYESLLSNPDENRRSDCLGQLIVTLVNAHHIDKLFEFPYHGIISNLEKFLETKARTLDIDQASVYYDTLYAIHVNNENFKKAATIMYENGLRSETTQSQYRCYLACLNALHLIDPDFAWIVKPSLDSKDEIVLLELKDIRSEYELSKARYFLNDCSTDATASEVVAMCVSEGLYKTAMRLCYLFKLGYNHPLEALTTACITMSDQDKAWNWLLKNDISDLVAGDKGANSAAWKLVEYLLDKYEEKRMTRLHQVVARKIMSHAAFLPHWLEASYKKRNPGELMRLYMRHGNLEQAGTLAKELLNAGLGAGREHFPLENSLVVNAPPIWLPINTIDALLQELLHHPVMKSMEIELEMLLDKYIETATRISDDKIISAFKN